MNFYTKNLFRSPKMPLLNNDMTLCLWSHRYFTGKNLWWLFFGILFNNL